MKNLITNRLACLAAGVIVVASLSALATPAHAACDRDNPDCLPPSPTPPPPPTGPTCPPSNTYPTGPGYTVRAVSFKIVDETHWDEFGSDEPYWMFSSVGTDGTASTKKSPQFGDGDSGESRSFSTAASSSWLWGNRCGGQLAPSGIGFSIQAWEHDSGDTEEVLRKTKYMFDQIGPLVDHSYIPDWLRNAASEFSGWLDDLLGWFDDDLIGSQTFAYSPSTLRAKLPNVGDTFRETRRYNGADTSGGADYDLTIEVKKVTDKPVFKR